jgi:hypothetical protein
LCAWLVGGPGLLGCEPPAAERPAGAPPAVAVAAAPGGPAVAWDGVSYRRHHDPPSGLTLDVPVMGHVLEARHYDTTPPRARHILTLRGPGGVAAAIDVWPDEGGDDLDRFFAARFGFLLAPGATVVEATATRAPVRALLVTQPRSPQAPGRTTTVCAAAGRYLRVTCPDVDDPGRRAVCERVVASLGVSGAPGGAR